MANCDAADTFVSLLDIDGCQDLLDSGASAGAALRHFASLVPTAAEALPPRRAPRFIGLHRIPEVARARRALRRAANSNPGRTLELKRAYYAAVRGAEADRGKLHVREAHECLDANNGRDAWVYWAYARRPSGGARPAQRTLSGTPQQQLDTWWSSQSILHGPAKAPAAAGPTDGRPSGACGGWRALSAVSPGYPGGLHLPTARRR